MKNRTGYSIMLVMTAALVIAGCSRDSGTQKNTLATPEETVQAYCDLDAKGTRLTSQTWSKVLPYIAWTEEAGFDRSIVIEGFKISGTKKQSETAATVSVAYAVLGSVSGDYNPSRKTETVQFKVKKTKDGWKITDPDFMPPHVLAKAMATHLEGTKKSEMAEKVKNDK